MNDITHIRNNHKYNAGFFDGEGCIGIYNQDIVKRGRCYSAYSLRITMGNTNEASLEALAVEFGGIVRKAARKTGCKQLYIWSVPFAKRTALLRAMLPYLIVKRRHAELALEYLSLPRLAGAVERRAAITADRERLRKCLAELNARGVSAPPRFGPRRPR